MIVLWLAYLVNVAAAAGFTVLALVRAKRIGGVAPWLLAAVGAIDAFLLTAYRILFSISTSIIPLPLLEGFDTFATMVSMVLVLVAFHALMPPVRRA